MHFFNQKKCRSLDQRDGKMKVNVPIFRFAHCTFGLDQAGSPKVQRNFGLDEEQVQKCEGISVSMTGESESPKEFRTRWRASPKVQRNFGLDEEQVQKCEGVSDSMKSESESPKESRTRWRVSPKVQSNFELDYDRVRKCKGISDSTRNNRTKDSSFCNPATHYGIPRKNFRKCSTVRFSPDWPLTTEFHRKFTDMYYCKIFP